MKIIVSVILCALIDVAYSAGYFEIIGAVFNEEFRLGSAVLVSPQKALTSAFIPVVLNGPDETNLMLLFFAQNLQVKQFQVTKFLPHLDPNIHERAVKTGLALLTLHEPIKLEVPLDLSHVSKTHVILGRELHIRKWNYNRVTGVYDAMDTDGIASEGENSNFLIETAIENNNEFRGAPIFQGDHIVGIGQTITGEYLECTNTADFHSGFLSDNYKPDPQPDASTRQENAPPYVLQPSEVVHMQPSSSRRRSKVMNMVPTCFYKSGAD